MRLLLCGGGTAGHINPAVAVADYVKQQEKDFHSFKINTGNPFSYDVKILKLL